MKRRLSAAVMSALCALSLSGCGRQETPTPPAEQDAAQAAASSAIEVITNWQPSAAPAASDAPAYVSPIDFETLWATNPDIYGWLYIPGSDINYPLLQNAEDDEYYLKHNSSGEEDKNGALFTQKTYNGTDLNDLVTVIYGHNMKNTAFAGLQELYSAPDALRTCQDVVIYLPDREVWFKAFAAVPYDNSHILYYHNFQDWKDYRAFIQEIKAIRAMGSSVDGEVGVSPLDRLLILSTCLKGNTQKRFLVVAVMNR